MLGLEIHLSLILLEPLVTSVVTYGTDELLCVKAGGIVCVHTSITKMDIKATLECAANLVRSEDIVPQIKG